MKRSESPIDCANLERDRGPSLRQGAGEAVWMLNPWSAAAASRFDRFVKDLPGYLLNAPPALSFLLCVIGYDCVLNEPDLIALAQAISNTPSFDPGVRITWTSDREGFRHTESRCLSVRTRLAGRRLANDIDWAASAAELERLLQDIYPDIDSALHTTALDLALTDARTWWYLHLPLCLYSHVRGAFRIPILDAQVLCRLEDQPTGLIIESLLADSALDQAHDHVGDRLLSHSSSDAPRVTPQTLALIQSVFSVTVNQTGLRLANHLNSKALRDKLTQVTEMIRSEGWIAAVLLSWALHLLTVGSIRKVNPAVSTISAYMTSLLEPLADALYELKYPPACFSQEDWYRLFDLLRQRACTGQHSAALASLHSWAVRTYGCDPMPDVMFQAVEATRVHANLVWPHEQQRALQYANAVSLDERVSQQVQVLLINLARYLERHAQDSLSVEAALAWSSMWQHKVLSLHDPAATRVLLRLLKEAGVPADSLVIRIQDGEQNTDGLLRTNAAVKDIRDVFFSGFGASVRIERVRPRRGHPLGYLVVTCSQISAGTCAPSAAVRTHEFHGLLFSLSVFHAFRRGV